MEKFQEFRNGFISLMKLFRVWDGVMSCFLIDIWISNALEAIQVRHHLRFYEGRGAFFIELLHVIFTYDDEYKNTHIL